MKPDFNILSLETDGGYVEHKELLQRFTVKELFDFYFVVLRTQRAFFSLKVPFMILSAVEKKMLFLSIL